MKLEKYSFGTGDRFGMQGKAQLGAIMQAGYHGIHIVPVWNKSKREHEIIHSSPEEVRIQADNAIKELNWKGNHYVDADHINLSNVEPFIAPCDFFTIDVAEFIGKKPDRKELDDFVKEYKRFTGKFRLEKAEAEYTISENLLREIAEKYLLSIQKAADIYQFIENRKGKYNFIAEVSMDEVNEPQTPVELFFILAGLSREKIPLQTIAPKFSGRFNKGVDYEGEIEQFSQEFREDLIVIEKAVQTFGLPENLKLSVHSGSDKFSIYPVIGKWIKQYNRGIHVKTAGTTWLEELIGLALSGGDGLKFVKSIYRNAFERNRELCEPYMSVIDINNKLLPTPDEAESWNSAAYANALRHIPGHPEYNRHFRQLLHVGYKIAAENPVRYRRLVQKNKELVACEVTDNLFERHIRRLFSI